MYGKGANHPDRVIAELADRQLGVVARWQLIAAGLSDEQIDHRIATGRLRCLFRGVYAVGHRRLVREAWWAAALLACGEGAVLCQRTAAAVWSFGEDPERIEVATVGGGGRKQDGILPRRLNLRDDEITRHLGLPVTTPSRTLVDLASVLSPRELRHAVERAQDVKRFDHRALTAATERHRRRPGVPLLAAAVRVTSPDADGARSELERLFLTLCRTHELPKPRVNATVLGRRRDFHWPGHDLVVETDGYRWHVQRDRMRSDRQRDRELTAAGIRNARYLYEEVAFEPARVATEIKALLRS